MIIAKPMCAGYAQQVSSQPQPSIQPALALQWPTPGCTVHAALGVEQLTAGARVSPVP